MQQSTPVTLEEMQQLAVVLSDQPQQQQEQPAVGAASSGGPSSTAGASDQPRDSSGVPSGDAPSEGQGPKDTTASGAGQGSDPSGTQSVYISWREQKVTHHSTKPSKKTGSGHAYVVRFYLIDSLGGEHLAAEGEDQGDAHYLYANQPNFPFLYCHNKQDVITWLEDILDASKQRAGYHTEVVVDRAPSDATAVRLPIFVAYRHEKFELADGRHGMQWFLIDQMAHEHLAITGEEKETRDGHYAYTTVGPFHALRALECGNQHEVVRWLDSMVVPHHPEVPSGPVAGKSTPATIRGADSGGGGGPTHSGGTIRSDTTGGGSRGGSVRGRGRGGASKKGSKRGGGGVDDLLRHATTNLKRRAGAAARGAHGQAGEGSPYRSALHDAEGREAVVGELKKWTQEEAVKREATKRAAMGFLSDGLKEGDAHSLQRAMDVLSRAASQPQQLPPDSKSATHQQVLVLVDVLGALRQVAHMYIPLKVLATPGLAHALGVLKRHQNQEVSGLSADILQQWLRSLAVHSAVLADPRYVQDPRKALAARLEDPQELEHLVAEITHQAHRQQQQQEEQQQQQLLSSGGGWLRGWAGRGSGSLLGVGGEAATPAGLSAAPSDMSLPMLEDAHAMAVEAVAAAVSDPSRTVERRRLDLSGLAEGAASTLEGTMGSSAGASRGPLFQQPSGAQAPEGPPSGQQLQQQRPHTPFAAGGQQHQQEGGGEGGHGGEAAGKPGGPGGIEAAPSQALLVNPMHMELDAQLL